MKLLYCNSCHDVFSISKKRKYCGCGKTYGMYINDLDARYMGPCTPIGFNNSSFLDSVDEQPQKGWGKTFEAFVIPAECPTFKRDFMYKRVVCNHCFTAVVEGYCKCPAHKAVGIFKQGIVSGPMASFYKEH